jgi:4-carboxymuconolactone decarboxylase
MSPEARQNERGEENTPRLVTNVALANGDRFAPIRKSWEVSQGCANHSNEEDMERREAGEKIMREMMGDETAERLLASAGSGTFGSAVAGYAIDQAFGEIWIRPGLDRKARSLVSMAVMIALRQPHEFAIHMNIGLNNGLTLAEIEEALIQTLPYVGFPAVATALVAAGKVIQERGLDKNPAYGGHRGLL